MEKLNSILKKLCGATGVSGLETESSKAAYELLSEYTDDVKIDPFYNVLGFIKSENENAKTLLLDAHIDQIGMIVTAIDEKGFIHFANCGGVDRRLLSAQEVTVHGKKNIKGVIGAKPPHLETAEEASKISDIEDMYIDVGYSKEELLELVSQGDRITIDSSYNELLNNRVSSKSLDDRAGVAAILYALELLKGEKLPYNLAIEFTSCEETSGSGAKVSSYNVTPDIAIAVDVSFALTPDASEFKCGKMDEGVMIGYSPVLNKSLCDKLKEIAVKNEIPYQLEIMGGSSTGTNADMIYTTKGGVVTGLLSIPQKYMHTPIEIVSLNDIVSVAMLIAEFVKAGE